MNPFRQPHCLLCHEPILPTITWGTLFSAEKEKLICTICESRLEKINGEVCELCNRPFAQLDGQYRHGDLCNDCVRWEQDPQWKGYLDKNISLFQYNDFLKEVIARFKFRGDYVIAKAFAEQIKSELAKLEYDLLVSIPLSDERLYERGFNQAEALLTEAGFISMPILTRLHSEKQSKKSRTERIRVPQVFQVTDAPRDKSIVLIDDVYTTGSTLRHAAKLLKESGAAKIQSITIGR